MQGRPAGEDGDGARRRQRRRLMDEGEAGSPPPPPAGGQGEGEGSVAAPTGNADGCFPDFQTWTDFDMWLDGKLVGAFTSVLVVVKSV